MKCLHNGYYEIRVVVAVEYVRHAEEQAARCGCFGAADYIQGVLNMSLLRDLGRTEEIQNSPPVVLPEFEDDDPEARW